MLLTNKNAVIYGGGGSLAGAIAKTFAAAGARVFLTGRNLASLRETADAIIETGGLAETHIVDAFDEAAINDHLQQMKRLAGTVDISFNLTSSEVVQDIPLVDISADDFINPVSRMLRTRFLTARAAGKIMMEQGTGVILSLTATPGGIGYPYTAGFSAACCAIESFAVNLAAELGIYGPRVINIRSAGSPDSKLFASALENHPQVMIPVLEKMKNDTMLKKLPLMDDIANTALFLSSDMAAAITGVTIDVTAGTTSALNYRVRQRV
jgi:NAD(P)-dependent dehydrogenase (short-subunit alcohol dehydrogenase family)